MPELPEVEVSRLGLLPFITGQRIVEAIFRVPKLRHAIPPAMASRLVGLRIDAILSVKDPMPKTTARLTLEGHAVKSLAGQALAGLMKPNLVSDLIQRGALR